MFMDDKPDSNITRDGDMSSRRFRTIIRRRCPRSANRNNKTIHKDSVFNFLHKRKRSEVVFPSKLLKPYVASKLPEILQPHEYNMGTIDKIFASQWIDCTNIVYGTKCNKLNILNVITGKSTNIPLVKGHKAPEPGNNCGIHSLEFNSSHTMLATGGDNPNDLCVYKFPEFEPICLGQGHNDWIFGIVWLNDYLVATGSRDGRVGIWDTKYNEDTRRERGVEYREPLSIINSVQSDEKVRAIQYNSFSKELASLSTKALLHIWDVNRFKTISSVDLPYQHENVCLCLDQGNSLYAVGSQSHVTLLDGRCPSKCVESVESIDKDAGIRSLSFHNMLVTVGTGIGSCSFLDLRTHKYLQNSDGNICHLRAGEGWLRHDEIFHTLLGEICFSNAIYTHCYDPTGSKLFTGGGPLAAGLYGNYATLWQ